MSRRGRIVLGILGVVVLPILVVVVDTLLSYSGPASQAR